MLQVPPLRLTLLHTNDLHGALTPDKAAHIRELKEANPPCLYFDSGDCIKAGNLAIPLRPDPAWALLAEAGCDAGTLGNRETHVLESAFRAKLAGAKHPLLCANLRTKSGERPLPGSLVIDIAGIRVGVIGAMVPMVTGRMKTAFASAYLWDPPIPAVVAEAESLRPNVDLLIALTHIGFREDRKLAEACPRLDLILGGHSHTVLESAVCERSTWIMQGGSHGHFVGLSRWTPSKGIEHHDLLRLS